MFTSTGQPFLISGSGTLGWDQVLLYRRQNPSFPSHLFQVAANLVEAGENALVLHTGYFGDSFADWYFSSSALVRLRSHVLSLQTYGANVDQLKAEIGGVVGRTEIEQALRSKKYKVLTLTHVDTSTGVLSDAKSIAETVRKVSPETLV